jgi:hypothetical protein
LSSVEFDENHPDTLVKLKAHPKPSFSVPLILEVRFDVDPRMLRDDPFLSLVQLA